MTKTSTGYRLANRLILSDFLCNLCSIFATCDNFGAVFQAEQQIPFGGQASGLPNFPCRAGFYTLPTKFFRRGVKPRPTC